MSRRRHVRFLSLATAAVASLAGLAAGPATTRSTVDRTLRCVIVDARNGGTLTMAGTRMRLDGEHSIVLADAAVTGSLQLDTKNKVAYRLPAEGPSRAIDFYTLLRALAADRAGPADDFVDAEGRRFPGHRARGAVPLSTGQPWRVEATVWTDPATRLPVRAELRPPGGRDGDRMLLERIEFDVPLDDASFAMTPPAEFKVIGDAPLRPPPTADEAARTLTITPGEGIGAARFGMPRAEVVAIFGEPEHEQFGTYLNYPSRGVQLVLAGGERDRLGLIIANPSDAANLNRHEFAGATREGVRIGSTRADVVAAYGPADPPPVPAPRGESLGYKHLGLQFSFIGGRVAQIFASVVDAAAKP